MLDPEGNWTYCLTLPTASMIMQVAGGGARAQLKDTQWSNISLATLMQPGSLRLNNQAAHAHALKLN